VAPAIFIGDGELRQQIEADLGSREKEGGGELFLDRAGAKAGRVARSYDFLCWVIV